MQSSVAISRTALSAGSSSPVHVVRSAFSRLVSAPRRLSRRNEATWRLYNLLPSVSYRLQAPAMTGEMFRVLEDLDRDGVAVTSASALFHDASVFADLKTAVAEREATMADTLAHRRLEARAGTAVGQKPYLFEMLGRHPEIDPASPFGRFALHDGIAQVANAYFGMFVRLRFYNVWYNFATTAPATQSQLWHRDPEDRYILKVFVSLSAIDDDNGPFTYAPGTHGKGREHRQPEFTHRDGDTPRSNDAQMNAVVPSAKWVSGVGPAGTIVFADTRGFHKGGLARSRDRIVYTCEFTSGAGGRGGVLTGR